MQEQRTMQQIFSDHPAIAQGLRRLAITTPTDFQQQLLQLGDTMDHLIVTAPPSAGKTVALLLHALKKFSSEEEGILVVLCHSRELSQSVHHFLSLCLRVPVINLFMQDLGQVGEKAALVGSPLQVNNLWKKEKDKIVSIVVPEADLLFGFGYGEALELLAGSLNARVVYKLACIARGPQIEKFKTDWMSKAHRVDYELAEQEQEQTQKQEQITHFYAVGDKMSLPISLYVTLKFGLVNPKILVLVQSLREVYRYGLLLERCRLNGVGVYNHEDPINLRFYVLSVWMAGTTDVLIATPQLLQDLKSTVFKKNARKAYKRTQFELSNMAAIITLGLNFLGEDFNVLLQPFQLKPFLMTFLQNTESEITRLQELIAFEREQFEHAIIKELPITRKQLQGFRYRIGDVWSGLSNHRADLYRQLDFKKKLLRTPELREQFQSNKSQREVLVKAINDLRHKIDHGRVSISEFIPEYLVPECLKASYAERLKVLRAAESDAPESHKRVEKVLRYVDLEEQNPETTDVSRLKLISARKRWKLLHGFKLKKRNKRMEQKGVFESG